ncbi:UNKNOWN [Stylonychia lemnae]|uniref:Kinase n=1 Tax=Stylonychia lemnae TaxID=5949 RepID=A0A078API1_STYLE|nr:UNKNOWN [Stylonychia lemnae]|eukprot:CDW84054.1 UNKNOWN [Stylonychia lemnae]
MGEIHENKMHKLTIAGGHKDRFFIANQYGESIIIKQTNLNEMVAYEKIFNSKSSDPRFRENQVLKNFLPKYYGVQELEAPSIYQDDSLSKDNIPILLENLLADKPNASILDLKMGTSSLSLKKRAKHDVERIKLKDSMTTTKTLGFRVTGYIIKDSNGNTLEKVVKPHGKIKAEQIPIILQKLLSFQNDQNGINSEAIEYLKSQISKMIKYFQNIHSRQMQCSSLFIIIDNLNRKYDIKIVDLSSCQDFKSLEERDTGFIFGLTNLLAILQTL